MKTAFLTRLGLVLGMTYLTVVSAPAAIIFTDTFTGVADGTGASSQGWFRGGSITTYDVTSQALRGVGVGTTTLLTRGFASQSLASDGDIIKLKFDLTLGSVPNVGFNFRVGLYNDQGNAAANQANGAASVYALWQGYNIQAGMGTNTGTRGQSETGITPASTGLTTGGDNTNATTIAAAAITASGHIEFWITRVSATQNNVELYTGASPTLLTSFTTTDAGVAEYTSFNSIAIGTGGTAFDMTLDNIQIETLSSVPEPNAAALAVGSLLMGWVATRRRRQMIG